MIFAALVGHNPLEITLRQAQGDFSLDASYDIFPNAIALNSSKAFQKSEESGRECAHALDGTGRASLSKI